MLQQIQFNQNANRANNRNQVIPMRNRISFGELQRTLTIIKPDAFQRGLEEYIETRLAKNTGCKKIAEVIFDPKKNPLPIEKLENHYRKFVEAPFFDSIKQYFTEGPIKVIAWEGDNAVPKVRLDTLEMRKELVPVGEKQKNIAHATEFPEESEGEIKNFFPNLYA